jgi:hypothetical protein
MSDQIGRHTFVGTEFPAQRTGLPVDSVGVAFRQIGVENHEIIDDDRIAVEARVLIGSYIECPLNRTSVLVEGVEQSGAGSDEQLVPNDRWGDGESAACVVLPEHFEGGPSRLRGRPRGHHNKCDDLHAQEKATDVLRHRRSVVDAHDRSLPRFTAIITTSRTRPRAISGWNSD